MLVDRSMQANANLIHDALMILTVQIRLDFFDNWNNLLHHTLTRDRCDRIEITFRLEVRFALLALQVGFHPANDRVDRSIEPVVQLGFYLLKQVTLFRDAFCVFGGRPDLKGEYVMRLLCKLHSFDVGILLDLHNAWNYAGGI